MTNAELIKALRCDGKCNIPNCPYSMDDRDWCDEDRIISDAAAALEAADNRIAELEAQMSKEGEWIDIDGTMFAECSVCGKLHYGCTTPYCDMCGARMKGERK